MNLWFDELIETFDRLLATYRELLETAKIKYHCLVSGHIAELEKLIYREKNQVEIAQLLEEKRQNIVNHYCQFYDIQEKNITVTSLINKIDNICREKICSCLDNLKHVIKELQEINQTNMTLIHYSLEITEDVMKIFCPSAYQYPVYQHTGKKQDNKFPKIFIDTEM
ncbi:MAG: flagellar protein FlgN [Planctomycetia bacterium]|nr:flagellar protein FlgN [Candidatus Brocadia sp.]QOJ06663.1 MAG: flagellar protein FlgN [Planctomycetia bacterium]TVL95718.1 MAG: hypothetical protein CV082_09745 [Candidatus Brocadia sp. BL1]HQU30435.1 flagellar protein FlgN [Candidatus Brocadia sapporoensis]